LCADDQFLFSKMFAYSSFGLSSRYSTLVWSTPGPRGSSISMVAVA